MAENNVRDLVFAFMDMAGITYEPAEEDCWLVHIPEAERAFFNGFEEVTITFNRDLALKHRELELLGEGSYMLRKIIDRLEIIPRVSCLFAQTPPELPPADPKAGLTLRVLSSGKAYYRQKIQFNFKVSINCDIRQEKYFSVLADPAQHDISLEEGLSDLDMESFSEQPAPDMPIADATEDHLRLYLRSCRELEARIAEELVSKRTWADQQFRAEFDKVNEFLEDQKRELLKKKENVCFHLYFFQKEEEIDKMIADLVHEQERKKAEIREKFKVYAEIQLINALVICVPTIGQIVERSDKKGRSACVKSQPTTPTRCMGKATAYPAG